MSDKFNIFSKSHTVLGESSSDLILRCRGAVKIQWGNKFIDLIKDGKINADLKFIFQRDSVGVKDGIYIIGEGDTQQIILQVNGNQINLKGEIGTTYVSFQDFQQTTSEQKYTALKNIGFIYNTSDEITEDSLKNGIIYIESEQKLYIVQEGELIEYTATFPNPYTKQFIIQKQDATTGSLVIVGQGIENSLAFDSCYLYSGIEGFCLDSTNGFTLKISKQDKLKISDNLAIFNIGVSSNNFQSSNATESNGFRLYVENGQSTLEVDNIVVRNQSSNDQITMVYPTYWDYITNSIISAVEIQNPENTSQSGIEVTLAFENKFTVGSILYVYAPIYNNSSNMYYNVLVPLKVEAIFTEGAHNIIYVNVLQDQIDQSVLQYLQKDQLLKAVVGQIIFLISVNGEVITLLRKSNNNLDLVQTSQSEESIITNKIITRIGDISDLNLFETNNKELIPIQEKGIYSDKSSFLQARYISDYNLPIDDNSSKFASTEWVNTKLSKTTTEIDFTIYEETVKPEEYFSRSDIWELYLNQEDNSVQSYLGYFGFLTIDKNTSGNSTFSAIVRSSWKNTWSHRSIFASYNNGQWIDTSTYIIKEQFNPGYYYSSQKQNLEPISPVYLGTDLRDFSVDSTNRYLWYTNDGEEWLLLQEFIDPVQNVLYIKSTTRNYYASEDVYCPAGFVCYSSSNQTIALGGGKGVSNYIEVLNEYVDRKPLTQLQNIQNIADKGQIPQLDGYIWLWSLKDGADPTRYSSWQLVSEINSSSPVTANLDNLSFGNCGGITSAMVWTTIDQNNVNTGLVDENILVNGIGTASNWEKAPFIKAFLITVFSQFLQKNQSRYSKTLGWSFNYDSIVHLRGWGGYLNFYIGAPENPTSDDTSSIDSLPKSVFLWVNGSVMCNGYQANFYLDKIYPGFKLNVGQCYQENTNVGNVANVSTFFDVTYSGLKVNVQSL